MNFKLGKQMHRKDSTYHAMTSKVKGQGRDHDCGSSNRCWPISRERKVTPKLAEGYALHHWRL